MSEIYCVMTTEGCYAPYNSTPYEEIIPEHQSPRTWIPKRPPIKVAVPKPPGDAEKEASRKEIMRNLLRAGHSVEEIESVYGKF